MAVTTRTALVEFYKRRYPQRELTDLAFAPTQFLSALPMKSNFNGEGFYHVWKHDSAGGTSATFASAATNNYASKGTRIYLSQKALYTFVKVDDLAIYSSKGKEGAFMEQRESEMEAALSSHGQALANLSWGIGSGYVGSVGSFTATTVTLANPQDSVNFHIGMKITAKDNNTGDQFTGAIRNAGAAAVVTKVNYDTGLITFVDLTGVIAAIANGDYLFVDGNTAATAATAVAQLGVAAYIPLTDPTAGENFLGADRSVNPVNLAGHRQAYLGSIEETVKRLDSKMRRRNKNSVQACWLSFNNMHRLEMELSGRVVRDDGVDAVFGLPGFMMATPSGRVKFMGDSFAFEDRGYLLDMGTWELNHLNGVPHIVDTDGNSATRGADYDGIEIRIRSWTELLCKEPSRNGVFTIG